MIDHHVSGSVEAGSAGTPDGNAGIGAEQPPLRQLEARILGEETVRVPVERLREHPRNPRRGDVEAIKASLLRHGQYLPLTVNRPTMTVLRGNHTLRAARALDWSEIDVYFVDVNEELADRILLVDNRLSDLAGYDERELAELLQSLEGDLAATGYVQADLDELLDGLLADLPFEEDDVPALAPEPVTRPGELVELGPHRLFCGDARDVAAYERLLEGEGARMLLTDPPYGVSYVGKTERALEIRNDDPGGLDALLEGAFRAADAALAPAAPLYIFHPAGPLSVVFSKAFLRQGWSLRQGLVWVKDAIVLGHGDYHYRHEPILYGFKPGQGRPGRGGPNWNGDNKQASVLEAPRPHASREHPTMKPVELLARLIGNSSRRRELVLDPFAGSGSTLLACERLGRSARLIELDPRYCDVIIARYQQATGITATRSS